MELSSLMRVMVASKKTTENRTEEGHYDLSGRKVEATDDGVQIIVYNDNTAKKVLK